MKYRNTLTNRVGKKGFTLVELLVSMGILVVLLGVTTPFILHFYRRYQIDTERMLLVSLFRQARTMSLDGQGRKDHGVFIDTNQYTVYEGSSYVTRDQSKDQVFGRNDTITITGPSEFDLPFRSLNGKSSDVMFNLDNGTKSAKIYVNTEGRIDWE